MVVKLILILQNAKQQLCCHLGLVLTGISQEKKENKFVEEQEFLLEGFLCLDWKSSRWNRSFYQVVDPNFKFHRYGEQVCTTTI
jgi:hypothetical protein